MKMLPINMTRCALDSIAKEPDEPRMRFIRSALTAAKLAMEMDAAPRDIPALMRKTLSMQKTNLDAWMEQYRKD